MTETNRSFLELHVAVFLFGFTAILGELITMHPLLLTWWRVVLTSCFFFFVPGLIRAWKRIPRERIFKFTLVGFIVAIHWLTFYASIKASNASITLVCIATTAFFTALLEPLVMKQKMSFIQVGLGILIIPGMALIVQATDNSYHWGIVLGLISAFLAASFGVLNKKWLDKHDTRAVTWIEMIAATLLLSLFIPFVFQSGKVDTLWPSVTNWLYLLILALLCTNLAYLLALRALRHLSAYTTALTINLEPIYGIILAALLLHQYDELNVRFYAGALVILLSVIGYSILKNKFNLH